MADIAVRDLVKIYGPDIETALRLLKSGLNRQQILETTGSLVAVANVSFEITKSEIFVVMGLSGSCKSTLLRCLNRLVEPTSGSIRIDGEEVTALGPGDLRRLRLAKLGMVFQHFALFPHKTVVENVEFGLKIRKVDRPTRRRRAMDVLAQVGLNSWADKLPASLSGGMQQRVGLARSLAADPDILLMDEAFSALDPLIRKDMQGELLEMQRTLRKTIIFITHDLQEALHIGDRIAVMKDGSFVQVGAPADIVSQPRDAYVAAFTADVDRSRVFQARHVMTSPRILPQGATAADLKRSDWQSAYSVDGKGAPMALWLRGRAEPISDFPATAERDNLLTLFPLCEAGLPIAVIGPDGRLIGILDPLKVFTVLSCSASVASPTERMQETDRSSFAGSGVEADVLQTSGNRHF
jgi:glycine betaine/proline transport system ATP-binding protein